MEQRDSDRNLDSLRQQIVGLEDELEETAAQLKAARDRYQYLLAVTPGVDSNGPPLRDFRQWVD
jgi:LytS/YehU family sensor histidine kinase